MLSKKNLSVKSTRVSDLLTIRENYKKHAETFQTIVRARKNVVPRVKEAARDFGAYLVKIDYIDADRFNLCVDNLEKHFSEYNTDAEARRVAKQYIEDINRRIEYGIKNRCAALVQDQLDNRGIITDVEARAILENVRDYCAAFDDVRGGFEVEVRDAKKCYTCRVWSNDTRRKILVYTSTGAGIMNEGQVEYLKSNGYTGDGVLEANLTQKTLDAAFYVGSITSAARRVVELQYFSVENQPAAETITPATKTDDEKPLDLVPIDDNQKNKLNEFLTSFKEIARARRAVGSKLYNALVDLRAYCDSNNIKRAIFINRAFNNKVRILRAEWEDESNFKWARRLDPENGRISARHVAKQIENGLTTLYNHVFCVVDSAPVVVEDQPVVEEEKPARPTAVEIASWNGEEETPVPAVVDSNGYILPNVETARYSHECNHMSSFNAARYIAKYTREIDTIRAAAARQIEKADPVFHGQIRGAVAYYERKRAQLENDLNRTGASYPAWFIAGPSKYNVRKSDAKNRRMDDLIKEISALYDKTMSRIETAGTVISSDNADALRLLRDKLEKLQARQKLELEANKYWRKNNYSWKGYEGVLKEETKNRELGNGYSSGFFTDNNAQEIRRIKERISELEKKAATNYGGPVDFDGGHVEFNVDENRLQLIFDDKPDADTRETLKKNGFRWSPRFGAWQRQLNHSAIWITKQLGYLPKDYEETVEETAVETVEVVEEAPAAPVVETVEETPAETVEENNVETVEEVEETTVEEIDDDETDDAEETTEEKERALELVAASTVERLGTGVVAWRHLKSDTKTAPRSWDRLRPYSLNNTLIIESTPETSGARLLITLDRADVKEDGESVIDWAQYDNAGVDVWQPKKFKFIPLKDEHGELIKDDDGKILATRKVSKYGKVTIHDADLFPWLAKKRAAKYAQLEKVAASEIKERDAKRAALLGAAPEKWASNLAQIVKRFFDGTKLTTERSALGQEIACAFIASRLGFDLAWNVEAEKKDAACLLALCTQGDKKHDTVGHALQVVLKHVNKCVASILYQSQPTAIKPREEKPAPVPTVEEKQPAASVKNDDEETIVSALESFEREATQAINTFGLVHQDNARRAENDALLAIEEARENMSVPDDALKIYSDRVERIHVDTALALKEEATRRYGAEFIDRYVTFC